MKAKPTHKTTIETGRFKLRGLDARAAQHELDHLDGVLITDYSVATTSKGDA